MEGFHHVGVPDSELANSEGAGAANLQEFEYLLELALNSLQNSYFGGIFCPTYDILQCVRSAQMVLELVLDQYMNLLITLG